MRIWSILFSSRSAAKEIRLPSADTWERLSPQEVKSFVSDLALSTDSPVEYDGILMKIRGDTTETRWHIGIVSLVSGLPWVLHALRHGGVLFSPVSKLRLLHLELVNYYRWLP